MEVNIQFWHNFTKKKLSGNLGCSCLEDGWTVIQSRGQFGNPVDHFYRMWDDYVAGFGVPGREKF